MKRRRKAAVFAAVAGTALGAGALGAWLSLPRMIQDEVVARAERRGLRCEIADTDVSPGAIVLRGVDLRDAGGFARVSFAELEIAASLFGLATEGAGAVARVEVRGGEVEIDASAPRPERRGGAEGSDEASSSGERVPALVARGVRATVRDEHGELARGTVDAEWSADAGLGLVVHEIVVAEGAAQSATVEELHVHVDDRRLSRVEARGVVVALSGRADEGAAGLLDRARAVRASASGEAAQEEARSEGERAAFAWLGAQFEGSVTGLTVRSGAGSSARDVLTDLTLDVRREGDAAFRTRGAGQPDHGGRLGWDLLLEPLQLRAVGSVELRDVALAVFEPFLPDGLPLHRSEDARLDGELRIDGAGDALHAQGRLAVRDLAVASERIAPEPIGGIALGLDGEATFRPEQRRLEIARLRVQSGAAHADVTGAIEWAPEHYLFDVRAVLPPTPCSDAISAIPAQLLQEMAAFSLEGTLGGRIEARVDSRDLESTILTVRVADGCRFETVPSLADLGRFEAPFLHRVEEPDGTVFEMTTGPGTPVWTPISDISPFMVHALLGHEDAGFFRHSGFSTGSIRDALVRNLRAGRYVMGASTISMQLVKNVFLRREKTLARKVQEVLLTWWIESAWPKERILELYLNVIEYGPGVYGVRNAAWHYFGVEPRDLSPAQSAYLATILPNPKAYHSHWENGALPSSWPGRLARFLRVLGERGRYDATAVEEGVREAEALRFHREEEPAPAPRTFQGSTSALPISGRADDASEAIWDEALDGPVADGAAGAYE